MATLTLTALWINLVATGAAVSAQSAPDRAGTYSAQGAVVSNAGGRRRSITGPGRGGTFAFTLVLVPDTDRQTLKSWMGQTVQVRDHRGQQFYGVFYGIDSKEYKDNLAAYEVSIVLNVVDVVEGV
jgi:hypothetical protein